MKKLLSLFLVLCMLFTGCFLMVSCGNNPDDNNGKTDDGKIDIDDVKNDPIGIIANATSKSLGSFFDIAGIGDTVDQAMKNGATTIKLDGDFFTNFELSEEKIPTLSATLYTKSEDQVLKQFALELAADDMKFTTWGTEGQAFFSANKALLGSDQAIYLELNDLINNYDNSALASLIKDTPFSSYIDYLIGVIGFYTFEEEESTERDQFLAYVDGMIEKMNPAVKEETVNGVEAVTVTYTLNNALLKEVGSYLVENYPDWMWESAKDLLKNIPGFDPDTFNKEMSMDEVNTALAQLDSLVDFNITFTASVAKDGGTLVTSALKGKITPKTGYMLGDINFELSSAFAADAITVTVAADMEDEALDIDGTLALTKTEKDGKNIISVALDASYKQGVITMNLKDQIAVEISYDKSTGDYTLTVTVNMGADATDALQLQLSGKATAKDGKATVTIDKLGYMNMSIEGLGLSVSFDTKAEIPATPTNAKNELNMTMEDWVAIVEDAMDAPLMDLIDKLLSLGSSAEASIGGTFSDGIVTYKFGEDGSFTMELLDVTILDGFYEIIDGNTIKLPLVDDDFQTYSFEYDGDTLTLSVDGEIAMILERID